MSTVQNNNQVTVHYVGKFEDGTVFDSSRAKEKPLTFTTGSGQVVPGFNDAVVGMEVGQTETFTISPVNAYGEHSEHAFAVAPKSAFNDEVELIKGNIVSGADNQGRPFQAAIEGTTENHVVLDMNHPLAGKTLVFEIEVLSTQEIIEGE